MSATDAQRDVWEHARRMWQAGLVTGSAGNVSRRAGAEHIAITPSGVPYDTMAAEEIVLVRLADGTAVQGVPSYELPMHLTIYRSRPEVGAIMHTHAPYVTTLSVLRRPLPPLLDEMVVHLGGTIEVTDYAFTGTDAVGLNVLRTIGDRNAVLLANHGNACLGRDLPHALQVALVMEAGAQVYVEALRLGEPTPLPNDALAAGRRLFEARHRLG